MGLLPVLIALVGVAAASRPSPAAAQIGASRTALVTVTDARGLPLVDLGPDDFVIREGTVAREILSVHVADYPIVVLVDTGGQAQGDFAALRRAVQRFVDRVGHRPLAVGTSGDPPALVTALDDERDRVAERIAALAAGSADSRHLDACALAARMLRETGAPFSAIAVVAASAADRSRGDAEDALRVIVDSGAVVHAVVRLGDTPGDRSRSGSQVRPVPDDDRPVPDQLARLRTVTQQTLGTYTPIYAAASYQAALDRIADRLASELLVEYVVPPGSAPSDVRVGVRVPGARVRGLGVRPRS